MQPISIARTFVHGLGASGLSWLALLWRGRKDNKAAAAPVNAVSHWLWPRRALREDRPSWKHTATGTLVHVGASMLWAGLYDWRRSARRERGDDSVAGAVADAAAVTALAAVVDLKLTPERFTPGFERRLSTRSLWITYACFAAGLAATHALARKTR